MIVKKKHTSSRKGFTLIETLIVATILVLLMILSIRAVMSQLTKSRDAQRKSDLQVIKTGFQEYYNDRGTFPEDRTVLENCGETFFNYIKEIPCDPVNNTPYIYEPNSDFSTYRVLASLETEDDEIIRQLACNTANGCGYPDRPTYNYGVSEGRRVSDYEPGELPESSPVPPSPSPDLCEDQIMIPVFCEEDGNQVCQACGPGGCPAHVTEYRCANECAVLSPVCDE